MNAQGAGLGQADPTGSFPSVGLKLYFNNAGTGITSVAHTWNLYMNNGVVEQESAANVQTHAYPYAASKFPYTNTSQHLGSW